MKKNKISKNWIIKQNRDIFVKKSRLEGYRSRAAYKLQEINNKFKILKNGDLVIDLGAAPGSWSQFVAKKLKNFKILSIDINQMEKIPNTFQIIGDFTDVKYQNQINAYFKKKVDVILSDMAVNTTGNKNLDSIVTGELCLEAMNFSKNMLKTEGKFISKIFMGSSFNNIIKKAKENFKETHIFKPAASRKDSKESFLICKYLR